MRFGSAVRDGTALVVGASGGIGRAFTERLLDDGRFARVIATHRNPAAADALRVLACISAKVGSIEDNRLGGWYGYRASKAALNMLMRTAAIEYRRASPASIVALLHPGTTDTELSRPFQRGVPAHKLFAPSRTVDQLMTVIEGLEPGDSGAFLSWDGSRLPW